jgi:hypothetical protein
MTSLPSVLAMRAGCLESQTRVRASMPGRIVWLLETGLSGCCPAQPPFPHDRDWNDAYNPSRRLRAATIWRNVINYTCEPSSVSRQQEELYEGHRCRVARSSVSCVA